PSLTLRVTDASRYWILGIAILTFLGPLLSPLTSAAEPSSRITFNNDVGPILTKLACNSGGCHGKSTGQNGFRLSLLGFEPAFDHDALLPEGRGRRIFVSDPDRSLLLQKATGRVPHGGGKRLEVDSDDYRVLFEWIAQGAIGPRADDPQLEQITVSPVERVFRKRLAKTENDQQQLTVTAHFSDGTSRDVTRRAVYDSNVPELATADERGMVTTQSQSGLFAIMVRFGGQIAVFRGIVPIRDASAAAPEIEHPKSAFPEIDRHLFAQWKQLGSVAERPSTSAARCRLPPKWLSTSPISA
ncbi:MAG: Ig-like domain-containing protein, partial [Planctomycetota bacterium]